VLATANTGLAADDVFYLANLVGDCDGDGEVGGDDYGTFAGEFGLSGGIGAMAADFNADGWNDLGDFAIMRGAIGNSVLTPTIPAAAAASPAASAAVVPVVSQALDDNNDANDDSIAIIASTAAIDLLMPSPSDYISGPPAISGGLSATVLQRAATSAYDLRPLGPSTGLRASDDPLALSESNGASDDPGDDLLADILAESALAVRLPLANN